MKNKQQSKRIDDALDKALTPPKRRPSPMLDGILSQYTVPVRETPPAEQSKPSSELSAVAANDLRQRVQQPPSTPVKAPPAQHAAPAQYADIKDTSIKDTHNTEKRAEKIVRVCSRFTLQECRRYADELRKDGIKNPGGYATKIHRSGEADEMIERFLNPTPMQLHTDTSRCPDCHGTGFYYPEGVTGGVAKCKHEKLNAA